MCEDKIPVGRRAKDLIGKKFGRLTVIKRAPNKGKRVAWECQCDCGNSVIVKADSLLSGSTKSCGCVRRNCAINLGKSNKKNLAGEKFGKLVALEPTNDRRRGFIVWKCQCDCGNIAYVESRLLNEGKTNSCGCLTSKGEMIITNILQRNNIVYEVQKTFETCRFDNTGALARFDFYINEKYLIEFDGIQHFEYRNSGWDTKEHFEKVQKHDYYKTQWCRENNIPLIRIPYTKLDTLCIEDLMLETTQFRVV